MYEKKILDVVSNLIYKKKRPLIVKKREMMMRRRCRICSSSSASFKMGRRGGEKMNTELRPFISLCLACIRVHYDDDVYEKFLIKNSLHW